MKNTIKSYNVDTIHLGVRNGKKWCYKCNQAVKATVEKITLNPKEVTCKNCKSRFMSKGNIDAQKILNLSTKKVRELRRKVDRGEIDLTKYEGMIEDYEEEEKAKSIFMGEEKLREMFSLNQFEVHKFGDLLLRRINEEWDGLMIDPDFCWGLEDDLNLLKKFSTIVVRLQMGRS